MSEARRRAVLDALGVDVYVRRSPPRPAAAAPASPSTARHVAQPPADVPLIDARRDPAPAASGIEASLDWEALRSMVAACTRCSLCETRTQTVFGTGDLDARWMFIGEAPGADEDRQGEPFVGRAGQLLTSMIRALGLRREEVYIANVLKCRPPGNRDPRPEEAASCRGYLERQIALVSPAIVIAVGRVAAQNLLATDTPLARLRGKMHALGARGWPLVVTYHPAYLLRSPGEKRKAWEDLLFAKRVLRRIEAGEASSP
jgi:uracil-DNA glycosylase family 4